MSYPQHCLPQRHRQQGAVLFIALIVLLLTTLLALTSMREVALESRITGNLLEQKRLTSTAESGLRQSEKLIAQHPQPLDMCQADSTSDDGESTSDGSEPPSEDDETTSDAGKTPCITGIAENYDVNFDGATAYSSIDSNTNLERKAYWYIRDTNLISSTDPECFLTGKNCVNFYEVNSQATTGNAIADCAANALCIRSVVASLYN